MCGVGSKPEILKKPLFARENAPFITRAATSSGAEEEKWRGLDRLHIWIGRVNKKAVDKAIEANASMQATSTNSGDHK